jgi:hypothetical protein
VSGVDLVQWIGAQLDEDQWYAEEAATHAAATGTFIGKGTRWHARDYDRLWAMGDDESKPDRKLAECGHGGARLTSYLARHDPARVLRETDAKRRTLIRCQEEMLSDIPRLRHFAKQTVREMAAVYEERPGYEKALASAE